jgi:hypothetical protein
MARALAEQDGGDPDRLHSMARDNEDPEKRTQSLAKGIGPVTTNIFLREMRGIWEKEDPLPGDLCIAASQNLGFIRKNVRSRKIILAELKALWKDPGLPGINFADFDAALVRCGIEDGRKKQRLKSRDHQRS